MSWMVVLCVWAAWLSPPRLPPYLHEIAGPVWRLLSTACQETMPGAAEAGTLTLNVHVPHGCLSPRQLCCLFCMQPGLVVLHGGGLWAGCRPHST